MGTATSPSTPVDEARFAEIEAAVASTGTSRRLRLLGVAAAVAAVLVVGSLVLARSENGTDVQSVGGASTTAVSGSVPGTDPTVTVPEVAATAIAADLAGLDAGNFTYPADVCTSLLDSDQGHMPADPFTLVDGTVTLPFELTGGRSLPDAIHISLDGVLLGDVTADGRDEAIVTLRCAFAQSDGVWPSIVVVGDVAGTPTVLGAVLRSGFETTFVETDPETGATTERTRAEDLVWVQAANGRLLIRWNQNGGIGSSYSVDQRETTVTYGWDGQTFVPLGESDVVVTPAQQYVPPALAPVESFDFGSIELPLDARMRAGRLDRVACGVVFDDVQPVDAQLVDGSAVVRDDGGAELGSVSLEGVDLANLDDDEQLEAAVRLRCTRGSASAVTLAVFEATAGPPDLYWSTTDFGGITGLDDVVSVEAGVPGQCPLILTYRASGSPDSGALRVAYRRDALALAYVLDPARCSD